MLSVKLYIFLLQMVKENYGERNFSKQTLVKKMKKWKNENNKNDIVERGCKHYIWHLKNNMFVFPVASDSEKNEEKYEIMELSSNSFVCEEGCFYTWLRTGLL